jgi:hypothetical protein
VSAYGLEPLKRSGVLDDDIRRSDLRLLGGLGSDALASLLQAQASLFHQARYLGSYWRGGDPDAVAGRSQGTFEQFDGFHDDHRLL